MPPKPRTSRPAAREVLLTLVVDLAVERRRMVSALQQIPSSSGSSPTTNRSGS